MASYNKVIMVGNLTRDPQLTYLPNQTPVCDFGLASNRRWRGPNGEQREDVCFIDCRCYGKQAETFCQYMAKGRSVLVEGRLQFDQWQSQDGQKRSKHRINVMSFQFMDSGKGGTPGQPRAAAAAAPPPPPAAAPAGYEQAPAQAPASAGEYEEPPPPEAPPGEDNIPF